MNETSKTVGFDNKVTARVLYTSPVIRSIFGLDFLGQVHPALNNIDKLRYHLTKWQRNRMPFGTDVMGVIFEFWRNEDLREYLARLELLADGQIFFIAIGEKQAKEFVQLVGFQMDMTFKGTVGDINEWVVAGYDNRAQLTLTYARVFTNAKTAEAYQRIFDTLAEVIRQYTGSCPTWRHIHGEGLVYVLADMDSAQAKGLGMHLNRIDPSRTIDEHLQHVLLACLVHFHRELSHKSFTDEIKKQMARIPYVESEEELEEVLEYLKARPEKEVQDWLHFYAQPWVISSLSPARTKVPQNIIKCLQRNTNASESNHANANRSGKNLSLHATIFR